MVALTYFGARNTRALSLLYDGVFSLKDARGQRYRVTLVDSLMGLEGMSIERIKEAERVGFFALFPAGSGYVLGYFLR